MPPRGRRSALLPEAPSTAASAAVIVIVDADAVCVRDNTNGCEEVSKRKQDRTE